ncbi:MAG: hypothetical protein U9N10_01000 [Bacillota bacterium]|nr:hypothetical protein [Bacillota bacterium]
MVNLTIWGICLCITTIFSILMHEIGHGISYYFQGLSVSTGFNKVGNVDRKPSQSNFRKDFFNNSLKWDLGVPITLGVAIISTLILFYTSNIYMKFILFTIAIVNSILRLLPMVNVLVCFLRTSEIYKEDEIEMGLVWFDITDNKFLSYVPPAISIVVSVICYIVLMLNMDDIILVSTFTTGSITLTMVISFVVNFKIISILDEHYRINWRV